MKLLLFLIMACIQVLLGCEPGFMEVTNDYFNVINYNDPDEDTDLIQSNEGVSLRRRNEYFIYPEDESYFRLIELCITADSRRIVFHALDVESSIIESNRIENRAGISRTFCAKENILNWDINFAVVLLKKRTPYTAGNLTVRACVSIPTTGEPITGYSQPIVNVTSAPQATGECGKSQYTDAGVEGGTIPSPSIVGGWTARDAEFPWQASLDITTTDGDYLCGGTLISDRYIITAAHCLETAVSVRTYMGLNRLSQANGNEFPVKRFMNHENYTDELSNDIAIVELATPISEFTDEIFPACLPNQPHSDLVGEVVVVSGWGYTSSGGSGPDELMYTTVPVMDLFECDQCINDWHVEEYGYFYDNIDETMMCAGTCSGNTRDTCQGDSGGPLVWKNDEDKWELIGVVSWGYGCAEHTPGVYADVYSKLDWITANAT